MHTLFRDFLRLRYDFERARLDHPGSDLAWLESELVSFQLYTLEEMATWVAVQRRGLNSRLFGPWTSRERGRREAVLLAWDETILSHLEDRWDEIRGNIEDNSTCYGVDFLRILSTHPEADAAFIAWSGTSAQQRLPLAPRPKMAGQRASHSAGG